MNMLPQSVNRGGPSEGCRQWWRLTVISPGRHPSSPASWVGAPLPIELSILLDRAEGTIDTGVDVISLQSLFSALERREDKGLLTLDYPHCTVQLRSYTYTSNT